MSKLFTYLNIKEGDLGLIDGETKQMAQVVEMMQGAYKTAPDGRKKEVLANMISETVAIVLARLNAIEGLSKDAKKKVEEENKELPKERSVPKYEPQKEQKQEPKQEEPKKEEEFKVGDKFYAKEEKETGVDMKYEVIYIDGEKFTFVSYNGNGKLYTYENTTTSEANDLLRKGLWVKIEESKQQEPKKEEYPFKEGEIWFSKLSNITFKILKIYSEDGEILIRNVEDGGKGKLGINTILDRIKDGSWTKVVDEKEEEEPKKQEIEEQLTQEEIKEAIDGLKILVRMGDEEAKAEIKRLKTLLKK